jgi:CDP-6-deoxy-D-xylo-4-hexulose-3-dehydrase
MYVIKVPLAMQGLEDIDLAIIGEVFASGNHTMGALVKDFESQFAKKIGASHAVMVNSGSSANLLALEAIVRPSWKDKIAFPSGSYIAVPAVLWPTTLWPIIQLGYRALLIDCEPNSLKMDINLLRQAKKEFGDTLVGAYVIHPLGASLDLEEIISLRTEENLFIIEDTCESLGSGNHGKYSGTAGNIGTFSFYFSHHMTTVEGGMVITNDQAIANDLISMRAHGWIRDRADRAEIQKEFPDISPEFLFYSSGYNFRPMEFQGALGLSQLKRLDSFIEKRIDNAQYIENRLNSDKIKMFDSDKLKFPLDKLLPVNSWMALPFLLDPIVDRNAVRKMLKENGVDSRPIIAGNFMNQPAAQNVSISVYKGLGNAEKIHTKGFMLGNHHNFSKSQLDLIVESLNTSMVAR